MLAVRMEENVEYLKDNEKTVCCIRQGNISQACEKIENLIAFRRIAAEVIFEWS